MTSKRGADSDMIWTQCIDIVMSLKLLFDASLVSQCHQLNFPRLTTIKARLSRVHIFIFKSIHVRSQCAEYHFTTVILQPTCLISGSGNTGTRARGSMRSVLFCNEPRHASHGYLAGRKG